MTKIAVAVLGVLIVLPSPAAAATSAPRAKTVSPTPTPRPSPRPTATPAGVPCGFVEFVPMGPPRMVNGTAYERIKVRASFPDGHTESAELPYPWIFPNGEQTDPWSATNLRRGDFAVTLQLPPADADFKTFPPLIRYVLQHTTADGYTNLIGCEQARTQASSAPRPAPPR